MDYKFKNAFTLVELLVVIAIIGILSGLIIVGMSSSTNSARIAKAQIFSNSLRNSLLMSLVSEWKFDCSGTCVADGAAATTAYLQDTWGNNSSGTINGSPFVRSGTDCIRGSCLDFTAAADYINIGNSIVLNLSNGYTVEGWAKYRTITGLAKSILERRTTDDTGWFIFSYRNVGSSANYIYNYVEYTNTSNLTQGTTPGATLQPNQWYHLTLTVDGTGVSKYYVDGELKDTRNPTSFLKLGGKDATNTNRLLIASWGSTGLDGLVDELRIYNSPISSSRIKENYYSGLNRLSINGSITNNEYIEKLSKLIKNYE